MKKTYVLALIAGAFWMAQPFRAAEQAVPEKDVTLVDDTAPGKGFWKIFDGKSLAGWDGHPKLWSVQDGAITGRTTAENPAKRKTFLIWTNGTVSDFELRCLFKIAPNNTQGFANSGIQYRSKVLDPSYWVVGGYQADMEAGPNYTGTLYEEGSPRGTMATRGQKVLWDKDCNKQVTGELGSAEQLQGVIKQGQWNSYVIRAKGNHLEQFINDKPMIDVTDDCEARRAMSGVLALQLHAGPSMIVQFKDIWLKKLDGSSDSKLDSVQSLQGVWRVKDSVIDGVAVPIENISNIVVTVKSNSYVVANPDGQDSGTFTADSSKQPSQMDIHPAEGPNAGQTILGIYELDGDRLRVCYGPAGSPRPAAFDAPAGSGRLLATYYRAPSK